MRQDPETAESQALVSANSKRDRLISEYRKYVHSIVGRLIHTMGLPSELYEEFVAAGYLGLVEAAQRFDFASGNEFKHFAFFRIRGAIIDSIRATSNLSGRAYRFAKALQAAQTLREDGLGKGDASASPGGCGRNTLAKVLNFAAHSALAFRLSMADAELELTSSENGGVTPEQTLEKKEEQHLFCKLIATLPPKERTIIEDYYFREKTFSEIAAQNKRLSKSWISRLHARALCRLKERYLEYVEQAKQQAKKNFRHTARPVSAVALDAGSLSGANPA